MGAGGCEVRRFTSDKVTAPSNKRLKLTAHLGVIDFSPVRCSLSAIR